MAFPLAGPTIERAFLAACRAELAALKPGNVHVHGAGHGMDTDHFERAAVAAAPFIADPGLSVGARILGAVDASVQATGLNTNLGIVLLAAPLAAAADRPEDGGDLRARLKRVLSGLDRADADLAYRAIAIANPAGLGTVEDGDVAAAPAITLRDAMALAADRDRIARAYVTDYNDVFSFALPALQTARRAATDESLAITALHMSLLGSFPDSHIARKYGAATAETVRGEAARLAPFALPAPCPKTWQPLLDFDASLKSRGLNPGTTADFVVATLFADMLGS